MRKSLLIAVAASLLAFGPMALAQDPLADHPHLKDARQSLAAAITALRAANDGKTEFGGHREHAEQLLNDADKEITEAAEYANQHKK